MSETQTQRTFWVGGNWKCNGTLASVDALVAGLNALAGALPPRSALDAVVAPVALHVLRVQAALDPRFALAAQTCHAASGAFTGELAAAQLADAGVPWCIVGHSERRALFGQSAAAAAASAVAACAAGVRVAFCVGESAAERAADRTMAVLAAQLAPLVAERARVDWTRVVIAYEPVWAIGTGQTATPALAQATHAALRAHLAAELGAETAAALRIVYGGSVKPANCRELAQCADVDGFLVGGASLQAETFGPILKANEPEETA